MPDPRLNRTRATTARAGWQHVSADNACTTTMANLFVREYGAGTSPVIVLHGGPAAAGDVAPLARELGKCWRVIEPFQRGGSGVPLTVATHVQDLDDLIRERCSRPPVLVGHSWGAMLALVYAAEHPTVPAGVILVGCGTFSAAARADFKARLDARLTPQDRADLAELELTEPDPGRRLAAQGRIMTRVYGYDIEDVSDAIAIVDPVAHEQTWADMMRRQHDGTYPAAFATIRAPVLMLHGEEDPHPGSSIREDLRKHVPRLEYREFAKCGHSPWLERQAKHAFLDSLTDWLAERGGAPQHSGPPRSSRRECSTRR